MVRRTMQGARDDIPDWRGSLQGLVFLFASRSLSRSTSLAMVHEMRNTNATPIESPLAHRTLVVAATSVIAMYRYNSPTPTTANAALSLIDMLETSATVRTSTISTLEANI